MTRTKNIFVRVVQGCYIVSSLCLMVSCTAPASQSGTATGNAATMPTSEAVILIKPTPSIDARMLPTVMSQSNSLQLEDTKISVNDVPGNLAWSRQGDLIAYTFGFSLWVVPFGRWNEAVKVHSASIENGLWDLNSPFIVWSPDSASIGITVSRQREPTSKQSGFESRIAAVNWKKNTVSLIAPDQDASLQDWSAGNQIIAYRPDIGPSVFDVSTQAWQSIPSPSICKTGRGYHRWSLDMLLWSSCSTGDEPGKQIIIYKMSLRSSELVQLPINVESPSVYTALPQPSPDGRWIAWIEDPTGSGNWRIMLYDQKQPAIVIEAANSKTFGTSSWQALTWAPNSKQLAFSAIRRQGDSSIRTMWILNNVEGR